LNYTREINLAPAKLVGRPVSGKPLADGRKSPI